MKKNISFSDDLVPWEKPKIAIPSLFMISSFKKNELIQTFLSSILNVTNSKEYYESRKQEKDFKAADLVSEILTEYHKFLMKRLKKDISSFLKSSTSKSTPEKQKNEIKKINKILKWLLTQTKETSLISILKTADEYAHSRDLEATAHVSLYKDRLEKDSGNKRSLFHIAKFCHTYGYSPPFWFSDTIFKAMTKILDEGYTFEQALGFTPKDFDREFRQITLASMVNDAMEGGLKRDEAIDLVINDAYYLLKWKATNKKGNAEEKNNEFYSCDSISTYCKKYKNKLRHDPYFSFFDDWFHIFSSDEYILAAITLTHQIRYNFYKECIGKDMSDNEITEKCLEITDANLSDFIYQFEEIIRSNHFSSF